MLTKLRLAALALPLALTLACTTVRAPASAIGPTAWARDGIAEPQVELYVESSSEVDPATLARASDDARRALREAVADRHAPGGDAILVVRAQAVSRTAGRRADQKAAIAGLVVGAVAIAAVVVLAIASGKGGGGVPRGIVPVPVPSRAPRAPVPWHPPFVQLGPPCPGPGPVGVVSVGPDLAPSPPGPDGAVPLPPPPPLELEERGYFARDLLRLELLVVDPRDGTVRAAKTVTRKVDVRDGRAVRTLVGAALDDPAGWWRASAPSSPPDPAG